MKKIIGLVGAPLIIGAPVALTAGLLAYGSSLPAQAQFLNYVDYIADAARARILQTYGYRGFADLPELRSAIENNQIPAGVGSDYYNAVLANAGLIQKIDFNAVFDGISVNNLTFSKTSPLSKAEVATALEALYSQEAWDLLDAYDSQLTGPAANSSLWEYMVPYFIQQKVIIYNPFKVTANPGEEANLAALKSLDQAVIDAVFNNNKTYVNILQTLSRIGFRSFAVNNYMRDNLAIASELVYSPAQFSMNVTSENYETLVNGFEAVVNSFSGEKRIIDSGYETLSAVHPAGNSELVQADVGLLYNGDALDAFIGSDQTDEDLPEFNAQTRVITPLNSTFLLDGVVVPAYVQGADLVKVNEVLRYALYDNVNNVIDAWDYDETTSPATRLAINEVNMAYANFDFVNYTTPFRAIYEDATANYFSDLEDATGNVIEGSAAYAERIFHLTGPINLNHLTTPIAPNLETRVQSAYQAMIRRLFS